MKHERYKLQLIVKFLIVTEAVRISTLNSIALLYLQVEEVVAGTNTGQSPALGGFYHYWEKRVFNALTTMIIGSMAALHALLQPGSTQRPPLCEVRTPKHFGLISTLTSIPA